MTEVLILGAGPAGLMAADVLAQAGVGITVIDKMPSAGRRLLMAGRGGLNLTHSEPLPQFLSRYDAQPKALTQAIAAFAPSNLQAFAADLGEPCFTGPSGRVFPKSMKASPLLRAWLRRLGGLGVVLRLGCRFEGWTDKGAVRLVGGEGGLQEPRAIILALGGASWPRLGADGQALEHLRAAGVPVQPFTASNCGVNLDWSLGFRTRFAGAPLKAIQVSCAGATSRGEAVVTPYGLEGGAIYALSRQIRDAVTETGAATLWLDLKPDLSESEIRQRLARQKPGQSRANRLRKACGLAPVLINLIGEAGPHGLDEAGLIKALPLHVCGLQSLDRAISSAGGVRFDALDASLMLVNKPGVFVAGEMLDFDAPTGGYLLQAAFSTGAWAAKGTLAYLQTAPPPLALHHTGQIPRSAV